MDLTLAMNILKGNNIKLVKKYGPQLIIHLTRVTHF